jgi:hypothetical protein
VQLQKSFVFLIDIIGYVINTLGMNKAECKKLEAKVSPKFFEIAQRFSVPAAWLAELACDLFADDPPEEIRVVSDDGKQSCYPLRPAK